MSSTAIVSCSPSRWRLAHAVGHGFDLVQQAPALAQQLVAGGGEARLARAAIEQQHVERLLELAHAVGQRRGHLAEFARRRGEAAACARWRPSWPAPRA